MESRKANLLIDVAKNIVEQYREQLAASLEEAKQLNLEDYARENRVDRVERCLKLVEQILNNFEKSVFDGEITDYATYKQVYDKDKFITEKIEYYEAFAPTKENKEDREIGMVKDGIERVFKQLAIPKYAIYPVVADLTSRYREENYMGKKEINEKFARITNELFNFNGKYEVGKLEFNNTLNTNMFFNTSFDNGYLMEQTEKREPVTYRLPKKLILDSLKIKEIVDKYINEEIEKNNILELDKQNQLLHNTFDLLRTTGNLGGGTFGDYSMDYYEYFKSLFKYNYLGGNKYLETPIVIKNKETDIKDETISIINEQIEELQTEKTKKEEKIKMLNELLETMHSLQEQNQLLDEQINELMSKLNGKTL